MSNVHNHAVLEFDILSKTVTDPNDRPIVEEFKDEILALCEKFGNSGQSGGSAPYTAAVISSVVKKLCLFEPISPISGHDDEWMCGHMGNNNDYYQNKRCGAIFKEGKDGRAYYLDAIVWKGDTEGESGNDWDTFSGRVENISSRQFIKNFPFNPKTYYIDVTRVPYDETIHNAKDAVSCGSGDFVYLIKDKKQLDEVYEYYDKN